MKHNGKFLKEWTGAQQIQNLVVFDVAVAKAMCFTIGIFGSRIITGLKSNICLVQVRTNGRTGELRASELKLLGRYVELNLRSAGATVLYRSHLAQAQHA